MLKTIKSRFQGFTSFHFHAWDPFVPLSSMSSVISHHHLLFLKLLIDKSNCSRLESYTGKLQNEREARAAQPNGVLEPLPIHHIIVNNWNDCKSFSHWIGILERTPKSPCLTSNILTYIFPSMYILPNAIDPHSENSLTENENNKKMQSYI